MQGLREGEKKEQGARGGGGGSKESSGIKIVDCQMENSAGAKGVVTRDVLVGHIHGQSNGCSARYARYKRGAPAQ